MSLKTLKVLDYRSKKIYIRHLYKELFEFLISWNNEIVQNLIEIRRGKKRRNQRYTDEELKNIIISLEEIAHRYIDNRLSKERSPVSIIKKLLKCLTNKQELESKPASEPKITA